MELLKFGKKNVDHFVCHPDATVPPKLVQILPQGHSHIFDLNAPNLKTKQDRIDAFMKTIAESVYTEEFDNQDKTLIDENNPQVGVEQVLMEQYHHGGVQSD